MTPVSFEGVLAIFLSLGAIPIIVLVGIIMLLKNRRHKIDQQSKLISQMIEKGEAANLDFKAMVEALNVSDNKQKTLKKSILKHLEYGSLCSLIGLFLLIYGVCTCNNHPIVVGGLLLTVGIAFLIMFFISKNYLKKEIEAEEGKLNENK
jgi:uncharacterized membrane protein HdeD (DUF308 family)